MRKSSGPRTLPCGTPDVTGVQLLKVWLMQTLWRRIVSGACFLAGGVLNCNLFHRRSVAVLCMLYKIRCNPMYPLCRASTCALCASPGYTWYFDRTSVYLCASPLQNLAVPQDFYSPLSLSLERSGWPCIWWCGIGEFQEQVQCLFVSLVALSFFVFNYFPFLFFSSIGWQCGTGVFRLIGCQSPSPGFALPIFFNNNNNSRLWEIEFWLEKREYSPSEWPQVQVWAYQNYQQNEKW